MITGFTTEAICTTNFSEISLNAISQQLRVAFDSKEQRDLFVSQFPKSIAVKSYDSSKWAIDWSEGTNWPNVEGNYLIYYFEAYVFITNTKTMNGETNEVTGATNEQGLKRLTRFYKAIEAELAK